MNWIKFDPNESFYLHKAFPPAVAITTNREMRLNKTLGKEMGWKNGEYVYIQLLWDPELKVVGMRVGDTFEFSNCAKLRDGIVKFGVSSFLSFIKWRHEELKTFPVMIDKSGKNGAHIWFSVENYV